MYAVGNVSMRSHTALAHCCCHRSCKCTSWRTFDMYQANLAYNGNILEWGPNKSRISEERRHQIEFTKVPASSDPSPGTFFFLFCLIKNLLSQKNQCTEEERWAEAVDFICTGTRQALTDKKKYHFQRPRIQRAALFRRPPRNSYMHKRTRRQDGCQETMKEGTATTRRAAPHCLRHFSQPAVPL